MFQHTVMAVRSTNLSSVSLDAEKKTTTKKTQKYQQFSLVLSVYLIPLQVSTCLQCPPHPDQTDVPKGNNIFHTFVYMHLMFAYPVPIIILLFFLTFRYL